MELSLAHSCGLELEAEKEFKIKVFPYATISFYIWMGINLLIYPMKDHDAYNDLCLAGFSIYESKRVISINEAVKKKLILRDNPANMEVFKERNAYILYYIYTKILTWTIEQFLQAEIHS